MSKLLKLFAPMVVVVLVASVRAEDKPKPEPKPEGKKGYIGIKIRKGDDDKGIVIEMVMDDSPAAKGGLKDNDVVVKINGKEVGTLEEFVESVRGTKVGDKITLTIKRDGKDMEIKITAGALPEIKD